MKVLVVGNGGREHALAWKAAQSESVSQVFVAPGNAGTAREEKLSNVDISVNEIQSLVDFAKSESIELTIIGPEAPLVAGVVDAFRENGLAVFGPTQAAAILEGSKTFSKEFLERHNIPTAKYQSFTDATAAIDYVIAEGTPIVIKADGLAAGKGVVIAQTEDEAITAINDMLEGNRFGEAGSRVVVEEFLVGEEASFIVMCDGDNVLPLASSQDHKARDEGDTGPNTGGMGAYSPAPVVDEDMHEKIIQQVIFPTIEGMKAEGREYTGFLYAGLMITEDKQAKVLEFNCRFGDPETQPIMQRLQSDLPDLCLAAVNKELAEKTVEWDPRCAVGVVLAAEGYPESPSKGDVINGLDSIDNESTKVFHAGTKQDDENIITAGGRVLCVSALGGSVAEAQKCAYEAVHKIEWKGMFFRSDIGFKAINREK